MDRLSSEVTPEQLEAEADYLADMFRMEAKKAAEKVAKGEVVISVTSSGRIRKNGPCPCGSNKKFKSCCLGKVRDGKIRRTPDRTLRARTGGRGQ